MIHFGDHIFQMGWFNHQPVNDPLVFCFISGKTKKMARKILGKYQQNGECSMVILVYWSVIVERLTFDMGFFTKEGFNNFLFQDVQLPKSQGGRHTPQDFKRRLKTSNNHSVVIIAPRS